MLEMTPDGSATLWSTRFGQHYHNRNGAISQARHVFLEATFTHQHTAPCVLEIGFGAGLNFLTTLVDTRTRGVPLHYLAFEFDPLPVETLAAISQYHVGGQDSVWHALLGLWPKPTHPLGSASPLIIQTPQCKLEIRFADASHEPMPIHWASAVYLDGFSPETNPELWTPQLVDRLAQAMRPEAWLATYSSAGLVKRALKAAGLKTAKRPGIAGKRECLHAQRLIEQQTAL